MTLKIEDILSQAAVKIGKISETPLLDAEMILANVLKISRFDLILKRNESVSAENNSIFQNNLVRRTNFEPVAYIIGEKAFFEDIFYVDRRVLIPRPETEFLVIRAIEHLKRNAKMCDVLDICCGSGCVGLSILRVMDCKLTLSDISEDALTVAKMNAERLFPQNDSISFIKSDLFGSISGKFDVITANPPYLSKSDMEKYVTGAMTFEPANAFYGGEKGIEKTLEIIDTSFEFLKPQGVLILELGHEGAGYIKNSENIKDFEIIKDYSGIERVAVISPRRSGN